MSKLLLALTLSLAALNANATPFTDDEITTLCNVITSDPILRAEVTVYVAAMQSGMDDVEAEEFTWGLANRMHRGGTFGVKMPVFSGYVNKLYDVKDFDVAMAKIQKQCETHLRTLK